MDNLSLIAAIGYDHEIGINNRLIWHIPEDLRFYRETTIGKNIIMGRKTFESMPPKALEGRNHIVLSTHNLNQYTNITCYHSINDILDVISTTPEEFVVVGGAVIYKEMLSYVDTMYLTKIIKSNRFADAYFPIFDDTEWDIINMGFYDYNHLSYQRDKYIRRKVR